MFTSVSLSCVYSCGNVAAIFELDEVLRRDYTIFEAAPNVSQIILLYILLPLVATLSPIECCDYSPLPPNVISKFSQEVRGEPTRKPIPEYFL